MAKAEAETSAGNESREVRCGCGALLARIVPGGVEIKCKRCKRIAIVPLTEQLEAEV